MPIYLGTQNLSDLYLGETALARVYLGETLVYQKGSGPGPTPPVPGAGVLFDDGWVSGISWTGNFLPRPQYTSIATYDFSRVETVGVMRLVVQSEANYSSVNHNCHVCTSGLIAVPSGAAKMKVKAYMSDGVSDATPYIKFGLLTADCKDAMDDTRGGQLSAIMECDSQNHDTTYELTLNSGIPGGSYFAVVNLRRRAKANNWAALSIRKVWFE